ncbi:MAG: thioredoxin [Clostridia bacterium]|nr:thioredoxin [Clostridia bacterium]
MGIRIALGVIALALIIWGILNGSMREVFIKAINICTECIGLG